MRMSLRLVLAALFGAALWFPAAAGVAAQCAPPSITLEPATGKPGDEFLVKGENFSKGCSSTEGPAAPDTEVKIHFDQGGKTWHIGTLRTADAQYKFISRVYVPDGDGVNESPYGQAPSPGAATVRAVGTNGEASAAFEVQPGPTKSTTSTTRRAGGGSGATTTTAKAGATSTSTTEAEADATTTTIEPDLSADTTLPEVRATTTSTDEVAGTIPLNEDADDDADARGPLAAVAAVLLASIVGTIAWRARHPAA